MSAKKEKQSLLTNFFKRTSDGGQPNEAPKKPAVLDGEAGTSRVGKASVSPAPKPKAHSKKDRASATVEIDDEEPIPKSKRTRPQKESEIDDEEPIPKSKKSRPQKETDVKKRKAQDEVDFKIPKKKETSKTGVTPEEKKRTQMTSHSKKKPSLSTIEIDDEDPIPKSKKSRPQKEAEIDDEEPIQKAKKSRPQKEEVKKRKAEDDVDLRTPKKKKEPPKPEVTPEEKKRTQAAGYFKYISRGGPKHLGSKEVPEGAKDCLKNLTFVTTGVMDSFERDDIKQLVEKYGGRLTGSVSGKTSYLMVGDEPGESKIKKAKDLKIATISEDEFLELIRKSNPNQPTKPKQEFFGVSDDESDVEMTADSEVEDSENLPCTPLKSPAKSSAKSSAKSPVKTATMSPEKSSRRSDSSKSPVKALTVSPRKSSRISDISKSPLKTAKESPEKSSTRSSVKSSQESSVKSSEKSPVKSSKESSVKHTDKSPVKSSKESSVKHTGKSPVKSSEKSAVKTPVKAEGKKEEPVASSSSSSSSQKVLAAVPVVTGPPSLMWVDKYKPVALKNIVGQTTEKSNANKLVKWLQTWFEHHGQADEKIKAAWPGLRDPEGKTFKAALLSGSPGIGKTTTAHLAVKQVGYDYFEMNASDTRNKNGLHGTVAESLDNRTMFRSGAHKSELTSKHVLIMDEVDGMSGNEDRGGIQELINLIKKSRVPIICICNDRNHQKIRSLANYCFDLRFPKPSNEQIKGMIQSICHKEKLKLPVDLVQRLISSTDMDLRQIINQLELIKASSDGGGALYNPKKDIKFGPWDVCRKVFSAHEHRGMSFQDKSNLFFQDYSFGPLFVQENYLKWTPIGAKSKYHAMDLIKDSAAAIATGDLVDNLIRRSNNWSLLPTQAIFSSLLPGEYMEGDEVSGIEFPRWLGKNSNKGKVSRLLQQLHTHVHLQVSGSLEALNMDYLPYLRRSIVNPLLKGDLEIAADLMQEYSLLREDLDSINEISMWPGMKNPMDKLDTKTKTAFTRRVNKEILPYSIVKITKGKGRKGAGGIDDELEGLEEDDEGSQSEEEEDDGKVGTDAMIKVRTSKAKKPEPKKETKKDIKKKEPTAGPSRKSRK